MKDDEFNMYVYVYVDTYLTYFKITDYETAINTVIKLYFN